MTQLDAPETRALVAEPLGKAKAAEERAKNARASGDLQHATELDVLALTWAQVASDLVRTAAAEKKLAEVQKQLGELEQKAARSQALIEQTIARRGRAEQNLATFEASKPASASKPPADKASAKKPALSRPVKAKGGDKK
ncbi:MAG TPA: hypothetical protein VHV51_10465 [Polyangiaceae bacterium]|nr:hypothetical protein [Polyangiaceae bacterium]